jgi:cyclomaltodextrinase / maltogenic alpha-amylase / neopullulanase
MGKVIQPEWSKMLTMYEVNIRQFSKEGTFNEFETYIPKLKELGIGIVWFMPIQPIGKEKRKGTLGSYYSISDYTGINSEFGTLEDFKRIVKRLHAEGMYVLLDWVANHTAWDNKWRYSNPKFYELDMSGNFRSPCPEWEDLIKLNYDSKEMRLEMIESMKYWVIETDIDGFRCDMAHFVPTDFWNQVRQTLDKVKPLFMLAESENRDLLNEAFNMLYCWDFYHLTNDIARGQKEVCDLDEILPHIIYEYPTTSYQLMFTSNHDENSWEGSAIERLGYALETMTVMIFTIKGMPLIYCGQEAGHARRLSFFDKDVIDWKGDKMFSLYRKLIALKKENKALWNGDFGGDLFRINSNKDEQIFAFTREKEDNKIFVILNLSYELCNIVLNGNAYVDKYKNFFTNEIVIFKELQSLKLEPWEYKVFVKNT